MTDIQTFSWKVGQTFHTTDGYDGQIVAVDLKTPPTKAGQFNIVAVVEYGSHKKANYEGNTVYYEKVVLLNLLGDNQDDSVRVDIDTVEDSKD